MKHILTLLLLIRTTFCGFSQTTVTWKETEAFPAQNAGSGNLSITIDPTSGGIYVGTILSGIFRSKDKGGSWEHVMESGVMIGKIVITPSHMFATGVATVYRSDDGGDTWTDHPVPTDHTVSDLVVLSNGDIVISTADIENITDSTSNYRGDGVFISKDNGATWTASSTGLNTTKAITHLAVDSKDNLYAGSSHYPDHNGHDAGAGIYYSSNKGNTWSKFDPLYFRSGPDREHIHRIYEVTALEVDVFDSVYFGFDGAGPNYQISGNFKNSYEGAIAGASWAGMKLKNEVADWEFTPMSSFYRSASGDLYASIHAPLAVSMGGPYVKLNGQGGWKRSKEGMTAPRVGDEFGYRQCEFAETSDGELFAVQHHDPRVYMAQKSGTTGIETPESVVLSVYPNPASNMIRISGGKTGNLLYVLVSMDGKQMLYGSINGEESVDVSTVPSGLYLLRVISEDRQQAICKVSILHE